MSRQWGDAKPTARRQPSHARQLKLVVHGDTILEEDVIRVRLVEVRERSPIAGVTIP